MGFTMFRRFLFLSILALSPISPAQDAPFPKSIVEWEPGAAGPLFEGEGKKAWDQKIRERGWILREGDKYDFWYTGYNPVSSPERHLGHATSSDGKTWTRDPANPIHAKSWVEDVCVVRDKDIYVMFAEGTKDLAHMMESNDGIHWTDRGTLKILTTKGEPIPPGPFGTPTAFVDGDTWYLFYERGDRGAWLATSKDRKVWTNVSDDPVIATGPEAFDQYAVAVDQVIKREGVYYAFYHANSHNPWDSKDWTTCVARSFDRIHWEKYKGNPILRNNASSAILIETKDGDRLYSMHPDMRLFVHPKK